MTCVDVYQLHHLRHTQHDTNLRHVSKLAGNSGWQTDHVIFADWNNLNAEHMLVVVDIAAWVVRHQLLCSVRPSHELTHSRQHYTLEK